MNHRRYLLIANPHGGGGKVSKVLSQVEAELDQRSIEYKTMQTEAPEHATDLARTFGKEYEVVVTVGGDGTINEVVCGLNGSNIPIGIIPVGTGNDFARTCFIPIGNANKAVDTLLAHDVKDCDVGLMNGKLFISVVGIGFEGATNTNLQKFKFLQGQLRILVGIIYTFSTYNNIPLRISVNGEQIDGDAWMLCIGNGWNTGAGLQVTPRAKVDDGLLDLSFIKNISKFKVLRSFPKLFNGTIEEIDELESYRASEVVIESGVPIPAHIDGELLDPYPTRIEIKVLRGAQPVIGNWAADQRPN